MRIVVCIKQVPDIESLDSMATDPVTGTIRREGLPSILNPHDEYAMEAALRLKEEQGAEVVAVSMGPPQAEEALLHCLAMGADEAVLITDRHLAGSDTLATSYALAGAVGMLGKTDLVFCGLQAVDGDTAQVGPMLAERLGLPQITYVEDLRLKGKKVVARRRLEDGCQVVECRLPLLVTVIKEISDPRIPTYAGLRAALGKGIVAKTAADLGLDTDRLGLSGSPTAVIRVWTPETRSAGRVLTGEPAELAPQLADILMKHISP